MPLPLLLLACDRPASPPDPTGSTVDDCAALHLWAPDEDGDGYGDEAAAWLGCEPPEGWVAVTGDCDDADASVHEGAPDTCGDAVDADCDGVIVDAPEPRDVAASRASWATSSYDVDGFGSALLPYGDGLAVSAPAIYATGTAPPGRVYLLDAGGGVTAAHTGPADSYFGYVLDAAELDGDGRPDLVVSSTYGLYVYDADGDLLGYVLGEGVGFAFAPTPEGALVVGGATHFQVVEQVAGTVELSADGGWAVPTGELTELRAAGDVDGDGLDELALVSWVADGEALDAHLALYTHGEPWDAPRHAVDGPTEATRLRTVGLGDVTGDGYGDLGLADGYYSEGDADSVGRVWLVSGPAPDPAHPAAVLTGAQDFDTLGSSLAAGPDWSGDGLPELVVGGQFAPNERADLGGEVWIYACGPAGSLGPVDADWTIDGMQDLYGFGAAVAALGDTDGDGLGELVVGQPGDFAAGDGEVHAFLSTELVR